MQGVCQDPHKPIGGVQGVETNNTNLELLVLHDTMDSLVLQIAQCQHFGDSSKHAIDTQ